MDVTAIETLEQLLGQMATITQQLDRRSALAVERLNASSATLDQGLRALGDGTERFARGVLQTVGEQAQQAIAQGAGNSLAEFNRQLQASAHMAQRSAHTMEEQRQGLATARHALVWHGLVALLIGSLLAAGAASYVGWKTVQEVKGAQFGQDILHATQSGALTRCGKALCVKVGKQNQRYGKDSTYVLVPE